jgi:hypothetical protein
VEPRSDILFIDPRTGERQALLRLQRTLNALLSADGRTLATQVWAGDPIEFWDVPPRQALAFHVLLSVVVTLVATGLLWYLRRQ